MNSIWIRSQGVILEAQLKLSSESKSGAVLIHPHPVFGGNMENNVIQGLFEKLYPQLSLLRFNFRGVGLSTGRFSGGSGEIQDALASIEHFSNYCSRMHLVGYSFGAWIAIQAGWNHPRVEKLVLISPPIKWMDFSPLTRSTKPKLILVGSKDVIAPEDSIREMLEKIPQPREFIVIPEADHFWSRGIDDLCNQVKHFLCGSAE